MNDIFDSKRIISLVHFIGKHQFVTDLHAKFLCCGAGDHDLIFLLLVSTGKYGLSLSIPSTVTSRL